jgi:hypothetical protein
MAKKKKAQHGGPRPGSGRPVSNPEGATIVVAASVPEALVEQLDELREQQGWNRSRAVTEAIRALLAGAKRGR